MRKNWIFFLGIGIWITSIAAFFEITSVPAFKSFIDKIFVQPNPVTSVLAFIMLGVIIWYILKGIELGKKQSMDWLWNFLHTTVRSFFIFRIISIIWFYSLYFLCANEFRQQKTRMICLTIHTSFFLFNAYYFSSTVSLNRASRLSAIFFWIWYQK